MIKVVREYYRSMSGEDMDNWIANQKTDNPRDDDWEDRYDEDREALSQAIIDKKVVLRMYEPSLDCFTCVYATHLKFGPDDDTDTMICGYEGSQCPIDGVWTKFTDKYGNSKVKINTVGRIKEL